MAQSIFCAALENLLVSEPTATQAKYTTKKPEATSTTANADFTVEE